MKNLPKRKQEELFHRITAIRKKAKVVTYSATYGVGKVKLSRSSGMSEQDAERLLKAFWEINWSIRQVADNASIRKIGGQMWLYNPVSRFWISLRYERDKFSSLNQSTGVFCFDSWVAHCWAKGLYPIAQFHDEDIVLTDNFEDTYRIMKESIKEVNAKLNLNVPLDVDPKVGNTYAEIH